MRENFRREPGRGPMHGDWLCVEVDGWLVKAQQQPHGVEGYAQHRKHPAEWWTRSPGHPDGWFMECPEATDERCPIPVGVARAVDDLRGAAPEPGRRDLSQAMLSRIFGKMYDPHP